MEFVSATLSSADAAEILNECSAEIAQITEIPPGDMRYDEGHPSFRQRGIRSAEIILAVGGDPVDRVAHLAGLIYQIRSNLIHGDKDPVSRRDRRLVSASCAILDSVLRVLERSMTRES